MSDTTTPTAEATPTTGTPAPETPSAPVTSTPAPDPAAEQQLADATTRAEQAAAERDELRAALDAVTKALNPNGDQGEQDPTALAATVAERDKQLDQTGAELRTARVELAAYKAAADQDARADRLLNSRSFLDTVGTLDPADGKFDEQLVAAIRAAVEADPDLYRATPAGPVRGGGEFNGAPAAPTKPTTLRDAIAARLGA
ncbi:hypothetical protein [Streptomyces noursei]|uniref:hypothetical protein n=1 Tax=Streptomyces noursei TaxID=1971 RepID=UPI0019656F88|nr:hypothetical protein [Streptomyces noursei]QRX90869.1 hypothetical protein JNO44_08525 [Streptomyces noursei]